MMGWSQEVLFNKRRFSELVWEGIGWQEFYSGKKVKWIGWLGRELGFVSVRSATQMACISASCSNLQMLWSFSFVADIAVGTAAFLWYFLLKKGTWTFHAKQWPTPPSTQGVHQIIPQLSPDQSSYATDPFYSNLSRIWARFVTKGDLYMPCKTMASPHWLLFKTDILVELLIYLLHFK